MHCSGKAWCCRSGRTLRPQRSGTVHAWPRPSSRAGSRRPITQASPDPADRQSRRGHVEGASVRAAGARHVGVAAGRCRERARRSVRADPTHVALLARGSPPERDPHPNLHQVTLFVLSFLDDATVWPALMVRREMALLDELGFGLHLSSCAATGGNDSLVYARRSQAGQSPLLQASPTRTVCGHYLLS